MYFYRMNLNMMVAYTKEPVNMSLEWYNSRQEAHADFRNGKEQTKLETGPQPCLGTILVKQFWTCNFVMFSL